jgi:hypothetical protein
VIISIDNADDTNSKSKTQNLKQAPIIKIPNLKKAEATLVFEAWILGFGILVLTLGESSLGIC